MIIVVNEKLKLVIQGILESKREDVLISTNTNLVEDLGFDSVMLVQLVVEIEDTFDIVFEDEDMDIDVLTSYQALLNLIEIKICKNDFI